MKFLKILALLTLGSMSTAFAQNAAVNLIKVGLESEQEQFIPGEAMVVKVAITNLSGRTLSFRSGDRWINLSVLDAKSIPVEKLEDLVINEDFTVANGEIAGVPVNLARYYELINPGRYNVRATVVVREIGDEVPSLSKALEVVRGTILWEEEFGLPGAVGAPPEPRKFALMQAPTGKRKQLNLYVRISAPSEGRIIKTFPISRLLGFSKPEAQIDSACNFHILNQSGQRSFDYFVISPDGKAIVHQMHEYSDSIPSTRPRLGRNNDGKILVLEGQRRFTPYDIPSNPTNSSNGP